RKRKKKRLEKQADPMASMYGTLRENVRGRLGAMGREVAFRKVPGPRLSDIILGLAQPLLDLAKTEAAKKNAVAITIAAWNCALLPPGNRERFLDDLDHRIPGISSPVLKDMVEEIAGRKAELYPDIRRFVMDFVVTCNGDEVRLVVATTL
ncbi:MAG: hypothetical protein ABIG68_01275, partial [Acidobacteriota bacterium]